MDKKSVHTVRILWGDQTVRICVGAEENVITPYLVFLRGVYGEDNVYFYPNTGGVERTKEEIQLAEQIWKQAHDAMIEAIKQAQKKLEADQKEEKTKEMMIDQKVADSNWRDMERLWKQKERRMYQQMKEEEERKRHLMTEYCPQCGSIRDFGIDCSWCGYGGP